MRLRTLFAISLLICTTLPACDDDPAEEPDAGDTADATADVEADAEPGDVDDGDTDATTDAGPDADHPQYDIASGPLEVGYSRVEIPWRVGAKPGQVGTDAKEGIEDEVFEAIQGIFQTLDDDTIAKEELFDESTQWALDLLADEENQIGTGEQTRLFEPSDGIEQPPDVKAVVLKRGDLKTAVVRADIYLMHEFLHRHVAQLVEAETGISRDDLFLVGTHNHSAPQPSSPSPGVWSLADGFDPAHYLYLAHGIAEAIEDADADRREARLRTRRATFDDVQFNIIGPSTIEMAPDDDSEPEEIEVGYPYDYFDDDLDLLYFDEAEPPHEPIALVFSLGMHPETLPNGHGLISGDFALQTEKRLRHRTDVPAMWLTGALGDIEPDRARNNPDHDFWRASFDAMFQMTDVLADGVESEFDALLDDESADTEPEFRNIAVDIPGTDDFPIPTSAYLEGYRIRTPRVLHGSSLIRIHNMRLGDALLVGLPAEVTTDLARNIKSRVDTGGEVHQGWTTDENPGWVAERVEQNFSTNRVASDAEAPIPIVTSMVNGYIGYVVTRWEYENREHYRMRMTPNGPHTADHLASHTVAAVDEMMGGERMELDLPEWIDADLDGVEELMEFFRGLDDHVASLQTDLPTTDSAAVGQAVAEPHLVSADDIDDRRATHDAMAFSFSGGTNDMQPPRVVVEQNVDGDWQPHTTGPSTSVHVLYDGDGQWTARWHPAYEFDEIDDETEYRFAVEGVYRSNEAEASEPDPLWDPNGENRNYEAVSEAFVVSEAD